MNRWRFVLVAAFVVPGCATEDPDEPVHQFGSVAKAAGVYLASGTRFAEQPEDDVPLIARSTDGLSWHVTEHPELGGVGSFSYGNGRWVAASADGLLWSDDGLVWNAGEGAAEEARHVTFGDGIFVAGLGDWVDPGTLVTSVDGVTWTFAVAPPPYVLAPAPQFVIDHFEVAGANDDDVPTIFRSSDGQTWTEAYAGDDVPVIRPGAAGRPRWIEIGLFADLESTTPPSNSGQYLDDDDVWKGFDMDDLGLTSFACGDVACIARTLVGGLHRAVGHPLDWAWQPADLELHRAQEIIADGPEFVAVGDSIDVSLDSGLTWTRVVE